jgi:hypothetical protein
MLSETKTVTTPITILNNVVIWHCPVCGMDQWAQWARKSQSEERIQLLENILNHPVCVGCEGNTTTGDRKNDYLRYR